jgi:hypothetical protein
MGIVGVLIGLLTLVAVREPERQVIQSIEEEKP